MSDDYRYVKCPDCGQKGAVSLEGNKVLLDDTEFIPGECPWCGIGLMIAIYGGQVMDVETFGTEPSEQEAAAAAALRIIERIS